MGFITTKAHFEEAIKAADNCGDAAAKHIAEGLLELTKTLATELRNIKAKADHIDSRVR